MSKYCKAKYTCNLKVSLKKKTEQTKNLQWSPIPEAEKPQF